MKVDVQPGKYILAVSGGVDSMILLDVLSKLEGLKLVVAHFNHGIREDSSNDEKFVRRWAASYGLPFEAGCGNLGPAASEDTARSARYSFLEEVKQKHQANAIITAHHQDDLIETAFINILRGTGPKGLASMSSNNSIMRPLLAYSKKDILAYACSNNLEWVEDPSNRDNSYLRNYIRNEVLVNLSESDKQKLLAQLRKVELVNVQTKSVIANISHKLLINETTLKRNAFISLPPDVSTCFLMFWLDSLDAGGLDRKAVSRLSNALKTAPAGSLHEVRGGSKIAISKKEAIFQR